MFKLFSDKGFWQNAARLALPVAIQNMLFGSFILADTLLVSQLGDISLAAVGMSGQWSWLMNMICYGICSATSVFVSQYWGIKDKNKIHTTMGIAVSLALSVGMVFFLFSFAFPHRVMHMFNSNADIIKSGTDYLRIAAFSYPPIALTNILSAVLRSTEKVRLPMYVSAVSTVLNIALDYCMIFGKFGFARMEIKGAALATAVSAWVGFVLLLVISFAEKNIIIAKLSEVFRITPQDIKYYFRKAIPVILNETLWGGGTFVFNLIFSNMGYEYYASITILKTFENLAYVFFIGLCSACSVMIGKSVGRGLISRGVDDSKRFLILVPIYAVVLGALSIIFRSQLVSIFDMGNNISELTISTAKTIIVIYSIELPARTLCYTFIVGILRSGGDTVTAARYDLSSLWLVSLPITLITAYVIKAPFVVCYAVMLVAEDYFKIIMCTRHYVKLRWIKPVTEEGRQGLKDYIEERQAKKLG